MTQKEELIAGIRKQHELLSHLVTRLQVSKELSPADCHLYEMTTKEVESNLKGLRKLAIRELIREISTQLQTTHQEELIDE